MRYMGPLRLDTEPRSAERLTWALFDLWMPITNGVFHETLIHSWLTRMGLNTEQITRLSMEAKVKLLSAIAPIVLAEGTKPVTTQKGEILPAAFELRRIFSATPDIILAPVSKKKKMFEKAFSSEKSWASPANAEMLMANYKAAIATMVKDLNASREEIKEWGVRAALVNKKPRQSPGPEFYYGKEKFAVAADTIEAIQKGESTERISTLAANAISKLVDPGLLPRESGHQFTLRIKMPCEDLFQKQGPRHEPAPSISTTK